MIGTLPIIADRVARLALLHEAPRRRAIVYPEAADRPLLCEYPGERIKEERGRILAAIDVEGSAYELLCAAIEADALFDLPVWGALPVRFLPTGAVTWVSPDHPAAATAPCVNGDRTEELARWRLHLAEGRAVLVQVACAFPP